MGHLLICLMLYTKCIDINETWHILRKQIAAVFAEKFIQKFLLSKML